MNGVKARLRTAWKTIDDAMAAAVFGLLKLVAPKFGCAFEELCSGASPVVAGPDRPEAVSAGPPATAPASGHPTSAGCAQLVAVEGANR